MRIESILDECDVLRDAARARLLSVFKARSTVSFPIRRHFIHPDDPRNMILPLRTRRDYTSVGRPTFLLGFDDDP